MEREKRYHSISNIVSAVYCEQKLILDRNLGDASPLPVRMRAAEGIVEHQRFAMESQQLESQRTANKQSPIDKRCFIASSIYGIDSFEAVTLRKWRDDVLLQTKMGRMFVYCYYRISPYMVSIMAHQPRLASLVRISLNWMIALLNRKVGK